MGKFSIADLINTSKGKVEDQGQYTHIKLKLEDIKPSDENFYSMNEIEELGKSILLVGLQQPIVLAKINDGYKIISGHRRREALLWLIENGYEQFNEVECMYTEMTETMFNLSLIVGNAFSRKPTDYDKIMQEKKLREALEKVQETGELEIEGSLRECIAELMEESKTKVAQLRTINNGLIEEAKEEVMKGQLTFTNAYKMSTLPIEEQKEVVAKVRNEEIKGKDIRKLIEEKKEQQKQEQKKEKLDKEAEPSLRQPACKEQLGERVKVSESDTLENKEQVTDIVQEFKIVEILQELIECYQLISANECLIISDILKKCNERVDKKKQ